jgi:ubiquinone/menaquinone biosynthesis C-methylase UbiE
VTDRQAICNYEGTSYRARFWEGQGRNYEDMAERIALRKLLPPKGRRLAEIGAGFGRLADLYDGYEQVILLDYAKSGLREAQERLGRDGRFVYVAANLYHLPLAPQCLDTAVTVRVLHHVADVPAALREVASAVRPGGTYVLEYANKRNLKSIARYVGRRQAWSPFAPEPYEFVALNFDFHPAWMSAALAQTGFQISDELAVSHFRMPWIKKAVPPATLANLDGWLQRPGAVLKLSPSIFVKAQRSGPPGRPSVEQLFRCPACGNATVADQQDGLTCLTCNHIWLCADGIYDFRWPVPETT